MTPGRAPARRPPPGSRRPASPRPEHDADALLAHVLGVDRGTAGRWSATCPTSTPLGSRRWWPVAQPREPLQHLTRRRRLPARRAGGRAGRVRAAAGDRAAGRLGDRPGTRGRRTGRRRPVHRVRRDRPGGRRRGARRPRPRGRAGPGRARVGRAQPRGHRRRAAARRHGRRVRRAWPAPSTWSPATRRTSRSTPGSRLHRRHATTTPHLALFSGDDGLTRCGSSPRAPPGCCGPAAGSAPSTPTSRGSRAPALFAAHRPLRARCATTPTWPGVRATSRPDWHDRRVTHAQRLPTGTDEEREAAISAATLAVQRGDLVVIPTDTVYGIAADAFDADAVKALLAAKGRGREMPPPVLVSAATTLDALATGLPDYARALIEAFWPGPLTLVCRAAGVPAVGPGRHPRHRRGPDARPRGRPGGARAHRSARRQLGQPDRPAGGARRRRGRARCSATTSPVIVDAGPVTGGEASTIVDVTGTQGRVLRRGALALEQLNAVLEPLGATPDRRGAEHVREYLLVFLVAAAVTYLLDRARPRDRAAHRRRGRGARPRRPRRADPVPRRARDARRAGGGVRRRRASCRSCRRQRSPFVFRGRRGRAPGRGPWSAASGCSTTCSSWTRSPSWAAR